MDKHKKERKEVAYFMRRLYKYGLTTTSGGNISLRLTDDIIANDFKLSFNEHSRLVRRLEAPHGTTLTFGQRST
jgi:ribulose-5-phosphate 4-epimerase/fuculose-1-phosphate aldolase